tara:strand:+ start:5501 stop:6016 length:516 start_codon:yes stop_codon:yes gene_type:complete
MQTTIKIFTLSFFIFIIGIFFLSLNKEKSYNTKSLVGKKLDKIILENFDGNDFLDVEELKKNDFTLINFWASWCSPCRLEHSTLMILNKTPKLKLVGINFKDKQGNAKNFLKELGNPYHFIAKDEFGKISINFGVYGIPESILINKELVILNKYIGPLTDEDYSQIMKTIN